MASIINTKIPIDDDSEIPLTEDWARVVLQENKLPDDYTSVKAFLLGVRTPIEEWYKVVNAGDDCKNAWKKKFEERLSKPHLSRMQIRLKEIAKERGYCIPRH